MSTDAAATAAAVRPLVRPILHARTLMSIASSRTLDGNDNLSVRLAITTWHFRMESGASWYAVRLCHVCCL